MRIEWLFILILPSIGMFIAPYLSIFFIACQLLIIALCIHKSRKNITEITDVALDIAGGNYGNKIDTKSAKNNYVEIANTLNTLSDCLQYRFEQSKIGTTNLNKTYHLEHTLQYFMAHIPIKRYSNDNLLIDSLHIFCHNSKSLVVDIQEDGSYFYMAESVEGGIRGMYDLFTNYKHSNEFPYFEATLKDGFFKTDPNSFTMPIAWSLAKKDILSSEDRLQYGDFIFLYNPAVLKLHGSQEIVEKMVNRVLRIFFQEGMSTIKSMLKKDIQRAFCEKGITHTVYMLIIQIL